MAGEGVLLLGLLLVVDGSHVVSVSVLLVAREDDIV